MDIQLTADRVYLAGGYTDMRKSIDGLSAVVSQQYDLNPFLPSLFLFCGRRRDRIKGLLWQGDGFVLLYEYSATGVPPIRKSGTAFPRKVYRLSAKVYRSFFRL
jgi:transposase